LEGVIRNPIAFYFTTQRGFSGPIQTLPIEPPPAGSGVRRGGCNATELNLGVASRSETDPAPASGQYDLKGTFNYANFLPVRFSS